jgi:hypothetical protein
MTLITMDGTSPATASPVSSEPPAEPIAEVASVTPKTRSLAYHIVRLRNSRTRLSYGRPRIEASYAAPGRSGESTGDPTPLRDLRLRAGFSIPALSRQSGVSVSTIRRIERSATAPRPHVVRALSTALGIAPWQVTEFLPVLATMELPRPAVLAS